MKTGGQKSVHHARLLWGLLPLVLLVDWLLPPTGWVSLLMVSVFTLLAVAWIVVVGGELRAAFAALAAPGERGRRPGLVFLFNSVLAVFVLAFLVGKWQVVLGSAGMEASFRVASRSYALALTLLMLLGLAARGLRAARALDAFAQHPARLMALAFGTAGLLGGLVLSLPVSVTHVGNASLLDSMFMAFSAICVTGLAVMNVATDLTFVGQAVLLALVQIGGLGIMVLSAAVAVLAGRRLRVRSRVMLTEMVDGSSLASLRRTVWTICASTLLLEGLGALALYYQLLGDTRLSAQLEASGGALWVAVFHAVSAFCNAGLSNLENGMVAAFHLPGVPLLAIALLTVGGLGFPVLDELMRNAWSRLLRKRPLRLSLHTRVAVSVSAGALLALALIYSFFEYNGMLKGLSPSERLLAAFFQSASARTAGFNVVDVSAMLPATILVTCAAMFVGASPGGTGGGIKVTTLATLYSGLRAELSSRTPTLFDRSLPFGAVRKSISVAFLSLCIVFLGWVLLTFTEEHPPLSLAFEVVSAFTTTGLSLGITPELSAPGKALVTLMMFAGRIGPLTLALAVTVNSEARHVERPEERVLIG
jgi:trk system potassium uptake protein TrkH